MINPREIRIGNYYKSPTIPLFRVDEIEMLFATQGKVGMHNALPGTHPFTWYLKDLEGIITTEDILLKAGFTKIPAKTNIFVKKRLQLYLGKEGCLAYLKEEDTDNCHYIPRSFNYFHQIQMLYSMLHGEELKLEL